MSEEHHRYDVVIFDAQSGLVSSVADFNLDAIDAIFLVADLKKGLRKTMTAEAVDSGSMDKGSKVEPTDYRLTATSHQPPPEPTMRFKNPRERQENSVCIRCESPDLATAQHCARCAREANEATSRRGRVGLSMPITNLPPAANFK